jgi:hypothetical protein
VLCEFEHFQGAEGVEHIFKIEIEILLKPDNVAISAVMKELHWLSLGSGVSEIGHALTTFRLVKTSFRSSNSWPSANGSTTQSMSQVLSYMGHKATVCAVAMVLQVDRDLPVQCSLWSLLMSASSCARVDTSGRGPPQVA